MIRTIMMHPLVDMYGQQIPQAEKNDPYPLSLINIVMYFLKNKSMPTSPQCPTKKTPEYQTKQIKYFHLEN